MNKKFLSGIAALLMTFSIAQADAIWSGPTSWDGKEIAKPSQIPDNQKGLHSDPRWQMLGKEWGINDGIDMFVDGSKIDLVNGVVDLKVGDEVTFEFNVHKTLWGVHTFDALKVWLDEEDFYANEWVFGETHKTARIDKTHNLQTYSDYSDNPNAYRYSYDEAKFPFIEWETKTKNVYDESEIPKGDFWSGNQVRNVKKLESLYYANADSTFSVTYTFEEAGEFDLVARVVCSSDLAGGGHPGLNSEVYRNDRSAFKLNQTYTQGETERIRIRVTSVPEPSVLILLGLSMFGVAFMRQKRK